MTQPALLPEHAHRALLYIERLGLVGVRPSGHQVELVAQTDGPRPALYSNAMTTLSMIGSQLMTRGTRISEPEPVVGYLARMGWITGEGRGLDVQVGLTDLGRALLVALLMDVSGDLPDNEHEIAMVLDPSSPFVYLELTGAVAVAGAGMVVDPHFKADMLHWLVTSTSITRLLIHARGGQRGLVEVALHGLRDLPGIDRLQVRASTREDLHDRCLVHADGTIRLLGTSLTGIGKHLTTITRLPDAATKAFKKYLEDQWSKATPIEPKALRRPGADDMPPT